MLATAGIPFFMKMPTSSSHPSGPTPQPRQSVIAPLAVLCLFAAVLPAQMAGQTSGVSKAACLTLSEPTGSADARVVGLLEACSSLDPGDVELLADLGRSFEATDRLRAEATYRRALALDPGYADLRLRLGDLLLGRGAADEALAEAEVGLQTQPNRRALLDLRAKAAATRRVP
jgi:tetratricopeptide (TPR) repeat protein